MWGAISEKRTGLPFTIIAGPRQRSHSRVRVSGDSWPYFTVSDSRLPQPGGPGPRIYIPQEQVVRVKPPGTRVPFRRLLRLVGLRWRYSNPPPRRVLGTKPKIKVMLRPTVQSASLSSNKSFFWGWRPDLYYRQTVVGLLMWGQNRQLSQSHSQSYVTTNGSVSQSVLK
jgi:hypothetical protein